MAEQAVRLQIVVDDSGTVAATTRMQALGDAAEGVGAKAVALDAVPGKVTAIGTASLSSLEKTRLLNEELGLRIPRSMQKVIAQSQLLSGAIGAIGGSLVAVGALQIFSNLAGQAINFYHAHLDVNAAAKAFNEEMAKRQDMKFINTSNLEASIAHFNEASGAMKRLYGQADQIQKMVGGGQGLMLANLIPGLAHFIHADNMPESAADATQQAEKSHMQMVQLNDRRIEQEHEIRRLEIETAHAGDSSLRGYEKINAELAKSLALIREQQSMEVEQEIALGTKGIFGSPAMFMSGVATPGTEIGQLMQQQARKEAASQRMDLARAERDAIIAAENEERDAGLKGESLLRAKWLEGIDAITRKENDATISHVQANAQRAASDAQYFAAYEERMEEFRAKTAQMQRDADLAGASPAQKIQKQTGYDLQDLASSVDPVQAMMDPEYLDQVTQRALAISQKGNQELLENKRNFAEQMQAITDRSNDQQMDGYARILADEKQQMDVLHKSLANNVGSFTPEQQSALEQGITSNAGREMEQERFRQISQTRQLEAEAAKYTGDAWVGAMRQIQDQYAERLQKENQSYEMQVAGARNNAQILEELWKQHNARLSALDQIRLGQIERQAEQERDAMAGALDSLIKNPLKFLEQRGEQEGMKLLANNIMKWGHGPDGAGTQVINRVLGVGDKDLSTHAGVFGDPQMAQFTASIAHAALPLNDLATAANDATERLARLSGGGTASGGGAVPGAPGAGIGTSAYGLGVTPSFSQVTGGSTLPSVAAENFAAASGEVSPSTSTVAGASASSDFAAVSGAAGSMPHAGGGVVGGIQTAVSTAEQGAQLAQRFKQLSGAAGTVSRTASNVTGGPAIADGENAGSMGILGNAGGFTGMDGGMGGPGPASSGAVATPPPNPSGAANAIGSAATVAGGALTVAGAYEQHKVVAGGLTGAMGGAEAGAVLGGPAGMVIGAVVGAIVGIAGGLSSAPAEKYNNRTVKPAIGEAMFQYNEQGDYMSTYNTLEQIEKQAQQATEKMGFGGHHYYQVHIKPEVQEAMSRLQKEEKAGRGNFTASAAQFHTGGYIDNFGSLATSGSEGFVHAMRGEMVMNPSAASAHSSVLHAMNAGRDLKSMLGDASSSSGGNTRRAVRTPVSHNFHFHSMDPKSGRDMIMTHMHDIREAMNASYTEYGGESNNA